jgi:hypothetical protein
VLKAEALRAGRREGALAFFNEPADLSAGGSLRESFLPFQILLRGFKKIPRLIDHIRCDVFIDS